MTSRPRRIRAGRRHVLLFAALSVLALALSLAEPDRSAALPLSAQVGPEVAYFDSGRPVVVSVGLRRSGPAVARIEIVSRSERRVVRGFRRGLKRRGTASGYARVRQRWAGRTWSGEVARPGRYSVRVSVRLLPRTSNGIRPRPRGWSREWAGGFEFRTHRYPVAGTTRSRGPVGDFGAPRTGGRSHEGYDILAPCGRRLLAARGGRVTRVGYDPVLYGHFLEIRGRGEPYRYFYSHLREAPSVDPGSRVRTGRPVGEVGRTGNAASTPCHLHFEIHRGPTPVDPLPYLIRWGG